MLENDGNRPHDTGWWVSWERRDGTKHGARFVYEVHAVELHARLAADPEVLMTAIEAPKEQPQRQYAQCSECRGVFRVHPERFKRDREGGVVLGQPHADYKCPDCGLVNWVDWDEVLGAKDVPTPDSE